MIDVVRIPVAHSKALGIVVGRNHVWRNGGGGGVGTRQCVAALAQSTTRCDEVIVGVKGDVEARRATRCDWEAGDAANEAQHFAQAAFDQAGGGVGRHQPAVIDQEGVVRERATRATSALPSRRVTGLCRLASSSSSAGPRNAAARIRDGRPTENSRARPALAVQLRLENWPPSELLRRDRSSLARDSGGSTR
eukprot:396207-Prymnesium_polylepis.2